MADDVERASTADVSAESTNDELPIDLDALLFGGRPTEAIVADLDGETMAEGVEQEVTDEAPMRATDADPGLEPIGGYRAEWRPSGGADEVFDSTADLRAAAGTSDGPGPSYGVGAIESRLRINDDVRFGDGADPPGDGSHDMDIDTTGLEPEPTDIWLGPAELPDDPLTGVVTEVSDTDAPAVATDGPNFEDVD